MKRANLIKTAAAGFFVFAILMLLNLVAAEGPVSARLTYGNVDLSDAVTASGADSVSAFNLTTAAASIELEDGTATDTLLFVSESGFEGVYFNEDDEIAAYDEETFTLNSVEYTIERRTSSFRISSAQTGSLMIGTRASNTLILPDSGINVKIVLASGERTERLPATGLTVVFNSLVAGADVSAAGERAADTASVSGDAPATAADGCVDADKDETNPSINASYVIVTSSGSQSTVADYCAISGDATRLYEAVCDGNTAKVEQVVCAENRICPEGEGACRERTGEAANKFCIDSDIMTAFTADALIHSTSTQGTTIGYYAATTTDGGREFGAWADYCRDSETLIEYYCTSATDNRGVFREIICPEGCSGGQCVTPPFCYDSDGGSFENVKGTVRGVTASGEYYSHEDACADANRVQEYSCDEFDEMDAFKTENKACGAGKHCNEGKCVVGEPTCNQCDPLNNFSIREGTMCNGTTPTAWNLKRCPAGQYCSANACVAEPKATIAQVTDAFNHRKKWAVLLNETLGWIETAKQIAPLTTVVTSGGYAEIMEEIATGLSGTQTLLLRRQINLDVQADFGNRDLSEGAFGGGGFPPI